ncbi:MULTISPECIES: hypothetical protein [Bacillus subtilis group]|jgi:hypothetical protein|nr:MULTISPECIES: hypothetical protein [Bacillus subtilis group]KYC76847.1 hypothetical protein B4092_4900 [Bacillus licheniformis]MEC1053189.1 hypothetical protein [Bacillus paralicheniformis]MEC1087741.1 hypothetical protein [Bacillus paralicheniformis]MEC1108810.1 hypothetical protein [Bacillus paralicheniformis]MEC1141089.1 hypothetical protein [Bacillus paralicheniformis]
MKNIKFIAISGIVAIVLAAGSFVTVSSSVSTNTNFQVAEKAIV